MNENVQTSSKRGGVSDRRWRRGIGEYSTIRAPVNRFQVKLWGLAVRTRVELSLV